MWCLHPAFTTGAAITHPPSSYSLPLFCCPPWCNLRAFSRPVLLRHMQQHGWRAPAALCLSCPHSTCLRACTDTLHACLSVIAYHSRLLQHITCLPTAPALPTRRAPLHSPQAAPHTWSLSLWPLLFLPPAAVSCSSSSVGHTSSASVCAANCPFVLSFSARDTSSSRALGCGTSGASLHRYGTFLGMVCQHALPPLPPCTMPYRE